MRKIPILLIRFYQYCFSPYVGHACRFHPTCSNYALESYEKHGFLKGSRLTIWRLLRCQPFAKRGFDPVPDKQNTKPE